MSQIILQNVTPASTILTRKKGLAVLLKGIQAHAVVSLKGEGVPKLKSNYQEYFP